MKLEKLPAKVQDFFIGLGGITRFFINFFRQFWKPPYEWKEIMYQSYALGWNSLMLVGITGFIIGMVMTIQMRPTMEQFGAEAWLPAMVSVSIIREIGPVLTALICAGKIGSTIGAELGSMKVTEQIDAMRVSGTNPFNYLVITRVLSVTLMVPILTLYADTISLFGSYVAVNLGDTVSPRLFFDQAVGTLAFSDIIPAIVKSFFFGFAIALVSCHQGFKADRGTTGVGAAASSAVVISSLFIFIIDLLAVQITQLLI
jgi:phospholipid/cholesterol/gamma-HCH transport system permease protein